MDPSERYCLRQPIFGSPLAASYDYYDNAEWVRIGGDFRMRPGYLCLIGFKWNLYLPVAGNGYDDEAHKFFTGIERMVQNHPFVVDSKIMKAGGGYDDAGRITDHNVVYFFTGGNFCGRIGYPPTVYRYPQPAVSSFRKLVKIGGGLAERYRGGSREAGGRGKSFKIV